MQRVHRWHVSERLWCDCVCHLPARLALSRTCDGSDAVQPWHLLGRRRPEQLRRLCGWLVRAVKRLDGVRIVSGWLVLRGWCCGSNSMCCRLVSRLSRWHSAERLHTVPCRLCMPSRIDGAQLMRARQHCSRSQRVVVHKLRSGHVPASGQCDRVHRLPCWIVLQVWRFGTSLLRSWQLPPYCRCDGPIGLHRLSCWLRMCHR